MKKLPLILCFLLMTSGCPLWAQEINEKYSYKDFSNQSFKDVKPEEFNNTTIIGSCFYQNANDPNIKIKSDIQKDIFPNGMTGAIFDKCNLDNVYVPSGNTVLGTSCHRIIQKQNDLHNWIMDKDLKPVEPVNKRAFEELNLSKNPKDIPLIKQTKSVQEKKREEIMAISNP